MNSEFRLHNFDDSYEENIPAMEERVTTYYREYYSKEITECHYCDIVAKITVADKYKTNICAECAKYQEAERL